MIQPKEINRTENKTKEELEAIHSFYRRRIKSGLVEIIFKKVEFLELLKSYGFYAYQIDLNTVRFVKLQNTVISEVNEKMLLTRFLEHIEDMPDFIVLTEKDDSEIEIKIDSKTIKEAFLGKLDCLFKKNILFCLTPETPIELVKDTKTEKFLFFKNGFVTVNAQKSDFKKYDLMHGYVWENQILDRNYVYANSKNSVFKKFCKNISLVYRQDDSIDDNESDERFKDLMSIVGYNLHNFYECKLFATILTDSRLDDDGEANGRSGKTLLAKGLSKILNTNDSASVYCEINGKGFNPSDKFKYSKANLDTKLLHINDCERYFKMDVLFNDITDGANVKKEHEKPFTIHPKIIVSTNQTINVSGDSAEDRSLCFELSKFYNKDKSPLTEFGHWFFTEWDAAEWSRFDNFMIECVQLYLNEGVRKPKKINLNIRTLIDHSNRQFVKWIDDQLSECDEDGRANFETWQLSTIDNQKRFVKKEVYEKFVQEYPDFSKNKHFSQVVFTKWLKMYFKLKPDAKADYKEIRSNGKDYFYLLKKQ